MSARGSDDVAAIRFDVDARAKYIFSTPDGLCEIPEEIMRPPAAGETNHRLGELAVLSFELIKGQITIIPWILIKDNEATGCTRRDRDIGIRMVGPPLIDLLGIRGGIFEAMLSERVLPRVATNGIATSALAILHPMAGKDGPAPRGISQGRCKPGVVNRMLKLYTMYVAPKRCCLAFAAP
jgi:hypothetical protein